MPRTPQRLTRPELDGAAISVPQLGDILEKGLLLGNGDLNGLLVAEKGQLVLRITKNDVWDARLPTENDPPLPTLTPQELSGKWGGKRGNELILPEGVKATGNDSYHTNAYPCPRACAVVRFA